jgi:hypothetical protein
MAECCKLCLSAALSLMQWFFADEERFYSLKANSLKSTALK